MDAAERCDDSKHWRSKNAEWRITDKATVFQNRLKEMGRFFTTRAGKVGLGSRSPKRIVQTYADLTYESREARERPSCRLPIERSGPTLRAGHPRVVWGWV